MFSETLVAWEHQKERIQKFVKNCVSTLNKATDDSRKLAALPEHDCVILFCNFFNIAGISWTSYGGNDCHHLMTSVLFQYKSAQHSLGRLGSHTALVMSVYNANFRSNIGPEPQYLQEPLEACIILWLCRGSMTSGLICRFQISVNVLCPETLMTLVFSSWPTNHRSIHGNVWKPRWSLTSVVVKFWWTIALSASVAQRLAESPLCLSS